MKSTIALNEMSWHFQTENIWATFYCVKIRCRQANRTVFDNVFTDSLFHCRKILFQESPDRKMRKLEQRFPSFRSESRLKPKNQILPCMFSSYSLTRDFRTKSFLVSYLFCNLAPCKE